MIGLATKGILGRIVGNITTIYKLTTGLSVTPIIKTVAISCKIKKVTLTVRGGDNNASD